MINDNWKVWGAVLKTKRKAAGLTQEQLAEKVGLDTKSISRYENGESTKGSTVKLLADAVNWSSKEAIGLAFGTDNSSNTKPRGIILRGWDKIPDERKAFVKRQLEAIVQTNIPEDFDFNYIEDEDQ